MGVNVRWDSEGQSTLRFTLTGAWTWPQMHKALTLAAAMVKGVPHEVGAIIDISAGLHVPGDNLFLPDNTEQITILLNRSRGRRGPIVVVGADVEARIMYDCLRMIDSRVGTRVYFTATLDEARAHLEQHEHIPGARPGADLRTTQSSPSIRI